MKKILFFIALFCITASGQVRFYDYGFYQYYSAGSWLYGMDLDGSTEYAENTSVVDLNLNGTDIITELINNDFENTGEEIVNNDFATDTWWSKNTGVTIAGGVCVFTSVSGGSGVWKGSILKANTRYQIIYTILNYSAGGIIPQNGAGGDERVVAPTRSTNGTYRDYFHTGTNLNFFFIASGTTTLEIDNAFLIEYPDWTGTGNHAFDSTAVNPLTGTYSGTITSVLGSDLVSGWDFTSGWIAASSTVDDLNSFTTSGIGGVYLTTGIFVSGRTYKIIIQGTTTASSDVVYDDFIEKNIIASNAFDGVLNTYIFTASNDGNVYLRNQSAGTTDITTFEVYQYDGDATTNYASLPASDFTALVDGNKYTYQAEVRSTGTQGSDLVTGWTNGSSDAFDTFTITGDDIDSGIESTQDIGGGASNTFAVTTGDIYKLTFVSYVLNSGVAPSIVIADDATGSGTARSNVLEMSGGSPQYFTVTATDASAFLQIYVPTSTATNFTADDFALVLVTPPDLTVQIGDLSKTFTTIDPTAKETIVWNFEYDGLNYYTFDGVAGSYLEVTSETNMTPNDNDLTIAYWTRHSTASGEKTIFSMQDSSPYDGLRTGFKSGTGYPMIRMEDDEGNNDEENAGTGGYLDGLWHHYAFVYRNGVSVQYYVDGDSIATKTEFSIINIVAPAQNLIIGATYVGLAANYDGDIRELKYYNGTALTTAQILLLFQGISVGNPTLDMIGDNMSSVTWTDATSNDNDATVNGGVILYPVIQMFASQPDVIRFDEVDLSQAFDMTTMFWFKTSNTAGVTRPLDYRGDGINQLNIYNNNGRLYHDYGVTGNTVSVNSLVASEFNDGVWHLFSSTIDRVGVINLYINGISKTTADITAIDALRTAEDWNIGASRTPSQYWDGLIGEVQIIRGQVLTAAEILTAYNRGRAGKHFLETGNEVGWWQFKGNNNTDFLSDETGNNNLTGINTTQSDDQIRLQKYKD